MKFAAVFGLCLGLFGLFAQTPVQAQAHAGHAAHAADLETRVVSNGASQIEVTSVGAGPLIVMLPSSGRGNEDFIPVARLLAAEGFRVALPQPRGAGQSRGPSQGVTMHDLASDIAAVIRDEDDGPAVVLGHAFGNFIARMTATDHPDLVRGVIIAAGGRRGVAGADANQNAAALVHAVETLNDPSSSREARLAALRLGFFAPGNDPTEWLEGWILPVFQIGGQARLATPVAEWWAAGSAPILEIQAEDDPFKPAEAQNELKDAFGPRVTIARIPDASHALFPEQPQAVVAAITRWMRGEAMASTQPDVRVAYANPANMNPDQKALYDALVEDGVRVMGPRLNATGPRMLLIHDPDLTRAWSAFGSFGNRPNMLFPNRYREIAILTTARIWSSQFEWYAHEPPAVAAGISQAVIEDLRHGRRPTFDHPGDEAIYDFATELQRDRAVSDATYRKVWNMLGTVGLLNLTVLIGHYTNVAMTLGASEVALPEGVEPPLPVLALAH